MKLSRVGVCLFFTGAGPGEPASPPSGSIFSGPPFSCIRMDFGIFCSPSLQIRYARRLRASSIVAALGESMRRRQIILAAPTALPATLAAPSIVRAQEILKSSKANYRLVALAGSATRWSLARDLEQPWSIAFLPDGRILVTERPGRLRMFANGRLESAPLGGVPKVYASNQGGLLDICLHPNFAQNRNLYLAYS